MKTAKYNFDLYEDARQAQKHIVDTYNPTGDTNLSSDEWGNPKKKYDLVVNKKRIATALLSDSCAGPGSITLTFASNATALEITQVTRVLSQIMLRWHGVIDFPLQ